MFEMVYWLCVHEKNEHLQCTHKQNSVQICIIFQYYVECVNITNIHVSYHLSLSCYVE